MEVLAYDDDLGPTAEEVKTSLQDDVALAFKTCNAQWKRIAELERQIAEARKAAEWTLIDAEHLPKVGDEVGGYDPALAIPSWRIHLVSVAFLLIPPLPADLYIPQLRRMGYTYYRPINAPQEPA